MDSLDAIATQQRIYEIEQKLKDLSLELTKLKQSLPPDIPFSNEDIISQLDKFADLPPANEQKEEEKKASESKEIATDSKSGPNAEETGTSKSARVSSKKMRNKSSYKVIAIEYCQKMNLSKPIEVCTERKDWNICWDYLSPKGCTRHDCRWTHADLNIKQRQIAKKRRKNMESTRFSAKVTIDEKSACGEGSSKGYAIYDAYRKLISMIIPKKEAIQLLLENRKESVHVKHPKIKVNGVCATK
eukprot:UN02551